MFESIRKHQRLLQFILLILILPAFMFFGISGYDGMLSRDGGVAKVGDAEISRAEFDAAQRQQIDQLRQMLGDGVDPKLFDTPAARAEILENLIAQRVVAEQVASQRMNVTDERVRQTILGIPGLRREDGSFDDARYKALLSAQNMTPAGFEARVRSDLALQSLPDAVQASAILPRSVRDRVIALQEEAREFRERRFAAADFVGKVTPTDAQIAAYYEANGAQFETPESARVEYVVLSREALASRITLGEDDLKTYYEQNKARFGVPEERRASHILVKAGPDARQKAQELLAKVQADPSAFAALAKDASDDPGSAAQGGDLGFFSRDMMVKPFADAAFDMKAGEIRGPVETEFGQHILRLTEIKGGAQKPFDEVRAEIVREVQLQQAARKYAEAAEQFTNTVYEQSDSLKPAAEKFGLTIESADDVRRQPAPGAAPASPLASPRLLAALFGDEALRNKRNTEAIEIGPGRLAAARIVDYREPKRQPLDAVRELVRERVVAQEATALAKAAGEAVLAELKTGKGDPKAFGAPRTASRAAPAGLPQPAIEALFRMPADAAPAYAGVELGPQGYAVLQLVKAVPPSAETVAQRQAAYDQQVGRVVAQQDVIDYVEGLKARTKIVRHLDRLGAPAQP
jgi:peptidyl-prolyl cis-trans isomerase D